MRLHRLLRMILILLSLAATIPGTHAASLLVDGNFDNLPAGTAPDRSTPAGSWFWPASYLVTSDRKDFSETSPSQVTLVAAPGGGDGNALHYSFNSADPGPGTVLPNILTQRVTKESGDLLTVSFDIYVAPGRGGVDVFLSNGGLLQSRFGPYLRWRDNGKLYFLFSDGFLALLDYPRGVWQTVRLTIDQASGHFDLDWSERGQPLTLQTRSGMAFAGAPTALDRLEIARGEAEDVNAYLDNFQVTTDPVITPSRLDLVTGESGALQLMNLKPGSAIQWKRNGANIDGATGTMLSLSQVTDHQAGNYSAVITLHGDSLTTEPSKVRVFNQLAITTPPQNIESLSGMTTGFSVTAIGPLPVSYQWRRNGVDLPGKTSRFLSVTASDASAGEYSVLVSSATGDVLSQSATLNVLSKPGFIHGPLSQGVVAGGNVTFSAQISGNPAPFTYQWRKGSTYASSTVLSEFQTSAKTAFLTLTNLQPSDAGTYRLYLANSAAPDLISTSPNRTFNLSVLPDTDGDGLPDDWELAHGFNPNDPADAGLDKDRDGRTNLAEYQSGTSPSLAASVLKAEIVRQVNGRTSVRFTAVANNTYTVEWSANAAGGTWEKLADLVSQPEDREETVSETTQTGSTGFYRIVTPRRP